MSDETKDVSVIMAISALLSILNGFGHIRQINEKVQSCHRLKLPSSSFSTSVFFQSHASCTIYTTLICPLPRSRQLSAVFTHAHTQMYTALLGKLWINSKWPWMCERGYKLYRPHLSPWLSRKRPCLSFLGFLICKTETEIVTETERPISGNRLAEHWLLLVSFVLLSPYVV